MVVCTIEIIDEVNIRLRGLDDETMQDVHRRLTFHVPNFQFTPQYKMGWWNGKVSLATMTGTTYLNLLPKIIPIIEKSGYTFRTEDKRREFPHRFEPIGNNLFEGLQSGQFKGQMEDHQVAAINAVLAHHQGVLEAATGAGKTVITAGLAKIFQPLGKIIIIVPQIDLALSTQQTMKDLGIECGLIYGEVKDFKHVIVSTWQSLKNFPEAFHDVVAVICDECHKAKAKEVHTILCGPGKHVPIRLGLTGTMPEEELYSSEIIAALGPVIFSKPAWELQQDGFLSTCQVYMWKFLDSQNPAYQKWAKYYFASKDRRKDVRDERHWQFSNPQRMQRLGELLGSVAETGNTLVLVMQKEIGHAICEVCSQAEFLYGTGEGATKPEDRIERYREVNESNHELIVATYGVASTGINIPRLFNLVLIEPGKAPITIIQSIGRGLRRADDKDHVNIWHVCSDARLSASHVRESMRIYKKHRYPFELIEEDYSKGDHGEDSQFQ